MQHTTIRTILQFSSLTYSTLLDAFIRISLIMNLPLGAEGNAPTFGLLGPLSPLMSTRGGKLAKLYQDRTNFTLILW